jgi:hypothetical protein
MLSGVRAECGVRGTVEGDMGENCEGEGDGAGEERFWTGWEEGGADGGGIRALRMAEAGWLEAGVCACGVCGCCCCISLDMGVMGSWRGEDMAKGPASCCLA